MWSCSKILHIGGFYFRSTIFINIFGLQSRSSGSSNNRHDFPKFPPHRQIVNSFLLSYFVNQPQSLEGVGRGSPAFMEIPSSFPFNNALLGGELSPRALVQGGPISVKLKTCTWNCKKLPLPTPSLPLGTHSPIAIRTDILPWEEVGQRMT